ncbi:hypothetical protein ACEWY4_016658 [Coilia grayii]|uniref:Uncharacterized protein n=1 Tax=Coilia grayii TaxID=363190 RepID=A0ABD1JKZ4_9TELE
MDYRFSSLKNVVVKEAPLQGTKMQRFNTQQALEMILDGANPCDSDGEHINLQVDSDSELSQLSSVHMDYHFSSLKNFVVKEAPLQGTKMQRFNTQRALEMILDGANPCDSDGEDINLQVDSDSELSQLSSVHMDYHFSSLKNFVVKEAPLQGTKMQRFNTQRALEMILDGANPCDSDGEDINLQVDSDSELSQLSSELLNKLTKEQIFKVAEHFSIQLSAAKSAKLSQLRSCLKDKLTEMQVLPASSAAMGQTTASSPCTVSPSGFDLSDVEEGLTFEQRKELLLLTLEQQSKERELDRRIEIEKMKYAHELEEKKLAFEAERLRLVSEGKLPRGGSGSSSNDTSGSSLSGMLKLLPRFNEKDPDVFFSLFETVADDRCWDDTERCLLLQTVLVGKAQEAYVALSGADRRKYKSVKEAVLKAYELVPEAYRQRFRTWRKADKQAHVEVARVLGCHFYRWLAAEGVCW